MFIKLKNKRAFTLIEILISIAVIGVLTTLVLASLSGSRERARDTRRKQDLQQMRAALEVYYNTNGQYPLEVNCAGNGTYSNCDPDTGWPESNPLWTELVGGGYIESLPVDPINDSTYKYYYEDAGNDRDNFCLRATLESGEDFYVRGGYPPYAMGGCSNN